MEPFTRNGHKLESVNQFLTYQNENMSIYLYEDLLHFIWKQKATFCNDIMNLI